MQYAPVLTAGKNTSATSAHTQLPDWYDGGPRFVRQMGPVQPLADVQKRDPVHVHDLPASSCGNSVGFVTHAKSSEDAQEAFTRLLPSLQDVHSGNFGTFLIELLKETHDHVPLQDFYCILYTDNSQEYIRALECEGANLNHQYYHKTLTGIKLQHLKAEDPSQTLPRALIYKAYYILCQKVFLKHPEISKSLCSPQSHILGQSRVGILTKLMHPNLVCKRLGKRGQSKSHYIGLIWNESMVDEDTIRLVNLDITDLRDYFQDQWQPAKRIPVSRRKQMSNNQELYSSSNPVPMISPIASSYSFVDFPYDPIVTNLRAKRTGTGPPGRASPRVFLDR
ncbi:hypothetical protein JCM33374_g1967 [Metschnikowia sp. JCM 33374]|nr:hypothetical protein JCM33374_g1967 [Metschnikowia sp. JCM 33374]